MSSVSKYPLALLIAKGNIYIKTLLEDGNPQKTVISEPIQTVISGSGFFNPI